MTLATEEIPASASEEVTTRTSAQSRHVAYTKLRQEQLAEHHLLREHYEAWLPLVGQWKRNAAGWTCATQPMFPHYLFVRTTPAQPSLARVRSTLGAVGLVRFGERAPDVAYEIVATLRRLAAESREPHSALQPGTRVRLVAGPLAGLQALVTASAARRLQIFFNLLGRDTRASVSPDQLESLPA